MARMSKEDRFIEYVLTLREVATDKCRSCHGDVTETLVVEGSIAFLNTAGAIDVSQMDHESGESDRAALIQEIKQWHHRKGCANIECDGWGQSKHDAHQARAAQALGLIA